MEGRGFSEVDRMTLMQILAACLRLGARLSPSDRVRMAG